MSFKLGIELAICPVATQNPVGGLLSANVFDAERMRPCNVEVVDSPRVRGDGGSLGEAGEDVEMGGKGSVPV